jgi:putative transposase
MARQPRLDLPGIAQHVVRRGVDRAPCFATESDYGNYLQELTEASRKHRCSVHAYVLMTNHVHLLVTPTEAGAVSQMMQAIGRRYVACFNARYRRTGTLLEGRFKASLVGSASYAIACYRYIELNPVRARMIEHPSLYAWSSYRHNALGFNDPTISEHRDFLRLAATVHRCRATYRDLVDQRLDDVELDAIRAHTQQQRVYGSDAFCAEIEALTQRFARVRPRGRPRNVLPVGSK